MSAQSFQIFAGAAAWVVGLCSLLYGVIGFFWLRDGPKQPQASLTYLGGNRAARQLSSALLVLGGLSTSAAVMGIHAHVSNVSTGWEGWALVLGLSSSVLTMLHGAYLFVLSSALSVIYAHGDATLQAVARTLDCSPSPLDPLGFAKYALSGLWLLVTGALMLQSRFFMPLQGYLALVSGIGLLFIFVGNLARRGNLMTLLGVPGSVLVSPLFWFSIGYTLWAGA
jgi:hypothetical protein